MTVDCTSQAKLAFKAKDDSVFRAAGGALGQVAVQELLTNPAAAQAMQDYVKYLNESDFNAVAK